MCEKCRRTSVDSFSLSRRAPCLFAISSVELLLADKAAGAKHVRERALLVARQDPPLGVSPDKAVAAVRDLLDTIGDTCPECPPKAGQTTFASARRRRALASVNLPADKRDGALID
jgi:hypothetical protein